MNTTVPPASLNPSTTDDKTAPIVSYLTLIGFVVAVILHGSKKTNLGAYHLRQSLGLMLTSIAVWVAAMMFVFVPFVGWLISLAAWVALFALWVMGLISAINGQMSPCPSSANITRSGSARRSTESRRCRPGYRRRVRDDSQTTARAGTGKASVIVTRGEDYVSFRQKGRSLRFPT